MDYYRRRTTLLNQVKTLTFYSKTTKKLNRLIRRIETHKQTLLNTVSKKEFRSKESVVLQEFDNIETIEKQLIAIQQFDIFQSHHELCLEMLEHAKISYNGMIVDLQEHFLTL